MPRPRKPRVWTATSDGVPMLGRGARRLAKRSAAVLAGRAVRKCLQRLQRLRKTERASKFAQGDVLVQMIDRHHLRAIDIARVTNQRPCEISEMYHTCRMFPPRCRGEDVPYNAYCLALRVMRKFRTLKLKPNEVLQEIVRLRLTQHRDVTAHYSAKARQVENDRAIALAQITTPAGPSNRAYHARFQSLLNSFPDRSIKVLHADPPYIYSGRPDGRYLGASARSRTCDSATTAEATALVIDLLRDWQPKLSPGGVLLLWQASGPLPQAIEHARKQYHWELDRVVIWDKGRAQAGDFASAYSTQCEWLWVLKRRGERLLNHDKSSRGDILRFPPVSTPSLAGAQEHAFEKPVELCRFLVGKHSYEQELVFDCCGCTGSMSVAAIEMNRNWVYAESNLANYRQGAARISRVLNRPDAAAG